MTSKHANRWTLISGLIIILGYVGWASYWLDQWSPEFLQMTGLGG